MAKHLREIVPLNELSKKTLGNYLDMSVANYSHVDPSWKQKNQDWKAEVGGLETATRKFRNRAKGIQGATARLSGVINPLGTNKKEWKDLSRITKKYKFK